MKLIKLITTTIFMISIFTISMQSAFAAGTETWYKDQRYPAEYTITNNNLTPVKTIAESGNLCIYGFFWKADSDAYSNVKLHVEIREYGTGRILASTDAQNLDYPLSNSFFVNTRVNAGQKIQIFFDVSSINNPPGPYRKATVQYEAYFVD